MRLVRALASSSILLAGISFSLDAHAQASGQDAATAQALFDDGKRSCSSASSARPSIGGAVVARCCVQCRTRGRRRSLICCSTESSRATRRSESNAAKQGLAVR